MRAHELLSELSYPGNIGMMELVKFQKVATPQEKVKMKFLLSTDKKAAWDFLQQVTGVKLQEQALYEIDMSPGNLYRLASATNALAGMEFEMAFPDVEGEADDDAIPEHDFSADDRASSFEGIADFFNDGDYNNRRDVQRLIEKIKEDYYEWASEKLGELWDDEKDDYFRDLMKEEFDFATVKADVAEELGLDTDSDEVIERVKEMFDEFVDDEWESQGRLYQDAYDSWRDGADLPDESDWFEEEGMRWMSDVYSQYSGDIAWPYYTYPNEEGVPMTTIGEEYSDVIGKPVNVSSKYHGAKRKPGEYSLEPDSSIDADEGGKGLEFISPPMPVEEMFDDLKKTIEWAKSKGAYTNKSTGLHMNVSIPEKDYSNLDFTKLALLLGDKHVLETFGREANRYAESALSKIQSKVKGNTRLATEMMDEMRKGMNGLASRAIANIDGFGKYTSINPKGGYVEFRSPGGDWLNENIDKLESTLLRFVVALDAALDPEKYRKEYLKKLYQLLQPKSNDDPIAYFAQYSAGLLPRSALASFVRNIQTQRQLQKDIATNKPTGKFWWQVNFGNYGVEVAANTKSEAFDKAAKEYGLPTEAMDALVSQGQATAKAVRRYEVQEERVYNVRPSTDTRHEKELVIRASSPEEAYRKAQEYKPNVFGALTIRDVIIMPTNQQ